MDLKTRLAQATEEALAPSRREEPIHRSVTVDSENEIQLIDINDINPSLENNDGRSIDSSANRVLAKSIQRYGLKEPLRIYYEPQYISEDFNYKYKVLSGHRRCNAWQYLLDTKQSTNNMIPCRIVKKPADEVAEKIDIAQSNMGRKDRKDLINEVKIASNLWDKICSEKREDEYKQDLLDLWTDINKDKTSDVDFARYKRNNFRPRLEFIRAITGLDSGNSSVKAMLGDVSEATDEGGKYDPEEELKEAREAKSTNGNRLMRYDSVRNTLIKAAEKLETFYGQQSALGKPTFHPEEDWLTEARELHDWTGTHFPERAKSKRKRKSKAESSEEAISDVSNDELF